MIPDTHLFFTQCHWLYVQSVRRAIRARLEPAYGEDWWDRGVLLALSESGRQRLQDERERNPGIEPELLLDAAHFGRVVAGRHNAVFADAFSDSGRAYRDFGRLVSARNQWAHIQSISPAQAKRAANLMRQILAALRCEEALEIAEMIQNFTYGTGDASDAAEEWRIPAPEPSDDDFDRAEPESALWRLWHQVQAYLILEKDVAMFSDISRRSERREYARVTLTIHNAAPDSKDWPQVHFRSVTLDVPGIDWEFQGRRERGPRALGELAPGQSKEIEIAFPANQLIAVEFVVSGEVDADKLFQFRQTANLPGKVIRPLQLEFVNRLAEMGINQVVNNALDAISAINPNMTFADVIRVRHSFEQLSASIDEKRGLIRALVRDFHLGRESALGQRIDELVRALADFNAKISQLDTAIANADLDLINQAVSELKQIQISVLRIEDTIRAMTEAG